MLYPALLWTLFASVGGYLLLIGHEKDLNRTNWWGVWLIFVGFVVQVYWEITHPWVEGQSLWQIIYVTVYLVIWFLVLIRPGWLRKRTLKK
jgi:hypothetical protein